MVGTLLWHQQPRCEIAGNATAAKQGKEYEGQAHQRDVNAEVVGQPGAGAGQNATGERTPELASRAGRRWHERRRGRGVWVVGFHAHQHPRSTPSRRMPPMIIVRGCRMEPLETRCFGTTISQS